MLLRILGWAVFVATVVAAAVLAWPQAWGLHNQWVAAHVVALRGIAAAGGILFALVFALFAIPKRTRRFGVAMATVLAVFAAANVGVLASRGFAGSDASAETSADPTSVTVLAWNTLGEEPSAAMIAQLALDEGADVIALPETTEELGEEIAVLMRDGGRPMWVHWQSFDQISKARSTTLLISPDLGDYDVVSAEATGPPGNTNTLPTVVADPVDGDGPRIIAVHAVAPIRWELRNWRSDLDWIADQCAGDDVIMAGDFNATVDHFAGRGVDGGDLGRCRDGAVAAGAGGIGTWPTDLPEFFGAPIDHVLATPDWKVASFRVLGELDDSGSDHRPVVSTLVRAG
ncbi:endonuclease/exonuclease/phosphatase family protein [Agromyces protaetiae]|uniref:Endonuclease/exonuclease/phosphatase family protein n=1 Tax=Agromyces protaetiae TaxID=2509455 RepID=A0A4P6FCN7_9MICO|nr:endonuclease/exonuclease/phosphatase family protein [Agromyces protaetiae]QAY73585.1 endonuclease/exonuclease/phosphatase family protein [Agromyces protaetiae]